ncbi:hypothetical protein QFZ79_004214 [Arthrobacter sp. V4I6]|nr:hypothetical protein [Arthrobacter sp. V1I7]MDQ0856103.1 hypothetical protein [Arthrobacter sp. V4I6]
MAGTTSFERGLMILSEIADGGDTTVESVALKLGIPVSTSYRYFRELREHGFVQEDGELPARAHAAGPGRQAPHAEPPRGSWHSCAEKHR